ncbi:MAG: proton-conducting membrane transporter, partial [Lachnospiraceae bacterium]|nr:proton-conducting membrane transporter [Lachnospiraceae bacterium]
MIMLVILIPILAGILVPLIPFKKRTHMEIFLETMIIINSVLVWYMLVHHTDSIFTLANFTGNLSVSFKVDGMS